MIVTITAGGHTPIDIQINVRLRVPRGYTLKKSVIAEAIRFRAEHGHPPNDHIELRILRWRTPGKAWRDGNEMQAWNNFRGILQRARLDD